MTSKRRISVSSCKRPGKRPISGICAFSLQAGGLYQISSTDPAESMNSPTPTILDVMCIASHSFGVCRENLPLCINERTAARQAPAALPMLQGFDAHLTSQSQEDSYRHEPVRLTAN